MFNVTICENKNQMELLSIIPDKIDLSHRQKFHKADNLYRVPYGCRIFMQGRK